MTVRSAFVFALLGCALLEARVTRMVIENRESPAYNGKVFGKAGLYELLTGRFYGELDPADPHNAIITDIRLAPRNARGMVEYSATFAIAKPIDMARSSHVLFYTVPNRGNGAPGASEDGHVSVVSGWQGDLVSRSGIQTIQVPVAKNPDGSAITGPVFERFSDLPAGTTTLDISSGSYLALTYQKPATLDTAGAKLSKRASSNAPAVAIANTDWAFGDCTKSAFPGTPDNSKICLKDGFDPAFRYELVFTAKNPLVLGIGFAATRDFNSFLRYAEKDDMGTANPVGKQIQWAVSKGSSQSGNFLRTFLNLGFNQDEGGRMVWDGVNPHIAARQLALNFRFAVGGGMAGAFEPGSEAVLWWSDYPDEARHRPAAGLLDRCTATKTCPKIMETFGGLEFWELRMSPDLVGTDAKADIPLPANVRRYFFPGTTHGGGRGGFQAEAPPKPKACVLPANPNPEADTMKALTTAFVDWVTKGTEMPASRYPRLDRGELVTEAEAAKHFPKIPGAPLPQGILNPLFDYDFGSEFLYQDLSGVIATQPPVLKRALPTLVPDVNADGSDVGGVPSVLRQAPLGSYLGWNVTATGFDKGKQCGLNGGFIPFAKTKAEREASGDPRLSLEERYRDHAGYVAAVKAAAEKAVKERFLLPADATRLEAEAAASDVLTR
ncbi:MAG TPA: alpha/beta hydrolase domain-containing protein [Bryobacteraceae bacterium]|jgi:hypothetical protein